jgi:hypothetical protein
MEPLRKAGLFDARDSFDDGASMPQTGKSQHTRPPPHRPTRITPPPTFLPFHPHGRNKPFAPRSLPLIYFRCLCHPFHPHTASLARLFFPIFAVSPSLRGFGSHSSATLARRPGATAMLTERVASTGHRGSPSPSGKMLRLGGGDHCRLAIAAFAEPAHQSESNQWHFHKGVLYKSIIFLYEFILAVVTLKHQQRGLVPD